MANRNFASAGKIYSMHVMPVLLDCNFVVDSANGNGLGIRNLKGPAIKNVFMHTSATPAPGNPNPAPGYIVVQLSDNYNRSLSGFNSIVSPVSGTPLLVASAGLTVGLPYIITSVGTTTQAQWVALGVPAGVSAAPGVSFIAKAASALGTGVVEVPAAAGSGITAIETVGDPNASIAPNPTANQGFGAQIILRCLSNGAIATPADNSVISLAMYLSNSSIQVMGE